MNAARDPLLGATLSGCVLERYLGRGSSGAAYVGRRQADGALVAVKVLLADGPASAALVTRLRREADGLRRVKGHPNLVAVLAASFDGPGPPHLVLELAPGTSLGARVRTGGRLPPRDAARVARDIARGLATIHGHGLLHRDVKPDNVVVDPDGRARLVDFGLVKDAFMSTMTMPGQLLGTAEYMAPEQWTGESSDARADLFSLGATLYFALTGVAPFAAPTLEEVMELAAAGAARPARELVPELPSALEEVLQQLLEPERRFRYARAERAAQDLERVLRGESPEEPPCLLARGAAGPAARWPLGVGTRWLIGTGPRAQVRLDAPGLAAEHAEVRRAADGFVLYDLRGSTGTWVGGQRVEKTRALADGDEIRVGTATLVVRDAGGRREFPEWLADLERSELPAVVVDALVSLGDPRVIAALLERLEPDPLSERSAAEALARIDRDRAPALLLRRAALAAAARAQVPARLAAAAGEALGADTVAWLSWWSHARGRFRRQVGPLRPPRAYQLTPAGGDPVVLMAQGSDPGLLLLGRDPRCHVSVAHPTVSRLHATILRLHRRLLLRDEGGPSGTSLAVPPGDPARVELAFLDPGATLWLGQAQVTVAGGEEPPADDAAALIVDEATFAALDEVGHAATIAGHVAALAAMANVAWIEPAATELHPDAPARAAELARAVREVHERRAARARQVLAALFRRDVGPDPEAWRALARGAGPLPTQALREP